MVPPSHARCHHKTADTAKSAFVAIQHQQDTVSANHQRKARLLAADALLMKATQSGPIDHSFRSPDLTMCSSHQPLRNSQQGFVCFCDSIGYVAVLSVSPRFLCVRLSLVLTQFDNDCVERGHGCRCLRSRVERDSIYFG